jgi:hypothetical protein
LFGSVGDRKTWCLLIVTPDQEGIAQSLQTLVAGESCYVSDYVIAGIGNVNVLLWKDPGGEIQKDATAPKPSITAPDRHNGRN